MKNVISLEASKYIQSVIKDMKTEYTYAYYDEGYHVDNKGWGLINSGGLEDSIHRGLIIYEYYKTLTTDEAIDIIGKEFANVTLIYPNGGFWSIYTMYGDDEVFKGETFLKAVEAMLLYLYDNKLLK